MSDELDELLNYKPTRFESILWSIEEFFCKVFSYYRWKRRIRFFYQRLIRGFDDSETWDLDGTFFRWFSPRLKRFREVSITYPDSYENPEDWNSELDKRIAQLERINCSQFDKDYDMQKYENDVKDFLDWFKNNIQQLWW